LAGYDDEGEWGYLGNDILEEEELMKREKGEYTPYKTKATKEENHAFLPLKRSTLLRLGKIGQTQGLKPRLGKA